MTLRAPSLAALPAALRQEAEGGTRLQRLLASASAPAVPRRVEVWISGEPVAQGRPRASIVRGRGGRVVTRADGTPIITVHDPEKSRSWKGSAQIHMRQAMDAYGLERPFAGAVRVEIEAYFTCPKSRHRKRQPREMEWRPGRPDAENVAKAALDAASGILFLDDAQVVDLRVRKFTAAQGEAPGVWMRVQPVEDAP